MLSLSVARAPIALVTLTSSSWTKENETTHKCSSVQVCGKHKICRALLVSVSRLIRCLTPPHFLMVTLLAGILANSPKAPTTLTNTSSGWSNRRPTRVVVVSYSWNLLDYKLQIIITNTIYKIIYKKQLPMFLTTWITCKIWKGKSQIVL